MKRFALAFFLTITGLFGGSTTAQGEAGSTSLIGTNRLSAGKFYTCERTVAGAVRCWGHNMNGQLGNVSRIDWPVAKRVGGAPSGIAKVSAGGGHTCALTVAGGLKCWGQNDNGEVGDGTHISRTMLVDVTGLTSGVATVSVGYQHTCAIVTGGGLKCWGGNGAGQLGDGTLVDSPVPVSVTHLNNVVNSVSSGGRQTCALTAGGAVMCWGGNISGSLGDGTFITRSTPLTVTGLTSNVISLAGDDNFFCVIITAAGVKCWGANGFGQLGDGSTTARNIPVNVVGLGTGVASLAADGAHTCAVMVSGGLKCWGRNFFGGLGNGGTSDSHTPVDVSGMTTGTLAVALGFEHTCAIQAPDTVKCWGDNQFGQLGDGTFVERDTPVNVINEKLANLPLVVH